MAWIEIRGKKYYVIARIEGKVHCISHGVDKPTAIALRDRLNKLRARKAKEEAIRRIDEIGGKQ